MRKLATIREIKEILPIEKADRIELAVVDGWQCVVNKGAHHVGEKVIYLEIDSFLPEKPEYEFLRKSSFKTMADGSTGFRLRTIKLRGQISQGLVLPVGNIDAPIGTDVTDILGVKKYEAPIPACISGEVLGKITGLVKETDQERIQNLLNYFEKYKEESFEISEKLDGTSMSIYESENQVFVAGHHWVYKESDKQTMWKIARRLEIPDRLKGRELALQGECIGEGIQSNKYGIFSQDWYIFDIWDIKEGRYLTPPERIETLKNLNLGVPERLFIKHVPILEKSLQIFEKFKDIRSLLKYSAGASLLREATKREGLVAKSCNVLNYGIVSFKIIDDNKLAEEKD